MTVAPRRLLLRCGIVPTILAGFLCLARPAFLSRLEYTVYDRLVRIAPTTSPSGRIAIVDVDERSLATVGQWPWRRDRLAELITRLRDMGAAAIAFDMVFSEPDRYEDKSTNTDTVLAEALRGGRVILGYALTFEGAPGSAAACPHQPLGIPTIHRGGEEGAEPLFRATGAICNLPVLAQAGGRSGFLNAAPDNDGLLRRAPLLLQFDDRVYPSMGLAAVAALTGVRPVALRIDHVNASTLLLNDGAVPLDAKGSLLLRYRGGRRTFPYVSASDVMSGHARAEEVKNRLIFVGTTALGTREVVATPLDTLFAGVEVHATVADDLLQRDFIYRPDYGVGLETQLVLAFGVAMALVGARLGLAWGAAAAAVGLSAVWAGAMLLISTTGAFLSPLFPTLGLTMGFVAMAAARFTIERSRADQAGKDRTTSQRLMVQTLLSLTEVRDAETGRHSRRTQQYTRILAQQLSSNPRFTSYLTSERIELLASLAPLHDIGKVGIPDRLLKKPGALTPEELTEMRKHPAHGRDVIIRAERDVGTRDDAILGLAKEIVYTHHEKWDGSGYPEGLRGEAIPIPGRLIALVDVYDAVTTRALYRPPMSHEAAVQFIASGKGTHFDPAVVDAFLKVADRLHDFTEEVAVDQPASDVRARRLS